MGPSCKEMWLCSDDEDVNKRCITLTSVSGPSETLNAARGQRRSTLVTFNKAVTP